jgi:polysaccharide biosynthesis transport protein
MKQISSGAVRRPRAGTEIEDEDIYTSTTEERHLRDHWAVLVKRRNLIILVFLVVLGGGAYFTLSSTPLYRANATIKIEPQNPAVMGIVEMLPSQAGTAGPYDYYQTQFALLGSRALAATVIRDLKLQSNPVFTNAQVITANPIDRIRSKVFGFLQTLASYASSSSKETRPNIKASSDDRTDALSKDPQIRITPVSDVSPGLVGRYRSFLQVNPVKNTRLVEVAFTTPNPALSQQLANAHAAGFIRMNLTARFELTNEAREFLDKKDSELKAKLERSEAALNRFRQVHGVVSLEKGENIVVDRLVDLNRQLTTAKAQRIEAESLHRTVENKSSHSLSQVVKEGLIPALRADLAKLEAEQTKLSTTFKPEHPRRLELHQQISETRRSIDQEIANVVRGIQENYTAALAKERALQAEADRQQEKALNLKEVAVQYAVLEETVKVDRALYESVLKRLSETNVANDLAVSNMRIVELAQSASFSSPDTGRNLLLSVVFGLFLGVGLAFLLEYLDSSVNTPEHVWRAVALSTFGVVPELNSLNRSLLGRNGPARPLLEGLTRLHLQAPLSGRNGPTRLLLKGLKRLGLPEPNTSSSELVLKDDSLPTIAESYRTIRTAFLFSQAERPPQIVLLTSPSPGEGKTQTTLNLAIALTLDDHRVLVIDADLRKGCCHDRLKMKNRIGLSHVLTGNLSLEEAIQMTPVSGLFLLSGGIRPPNPSDLLGSRKMREILKSLRESFNFILIDSPPAIAVSDAAVLSMVSDGVILVFHGQRTTTASARQAVERLDAIRAPILGVILNGIDLRNSSYAYYRHYYGSDYYGPGAQQPNNGSETSIETFSTEMLKEEVSPNESRPGTDLSEEEIWAREPGSGTVPREFFDRMTSELRDAVGPMAPVIVWDHIGLLGESRDGFPKRRLKELVENVCQEVLNDKLRQGFRSAMDQGLRSL